MSGSSLITCQASQEASAGENNLNGIKDFRTENGSSRGQNLAMTVSFMPNSRFFPQNQEVHAADRVVGEEFLNDELLVRIHSIIDMILVDRPCTM